MEAEAIQRERDNPYASPHTSAVPSPDAHTAAALRQVGLGLALVYTGIVVMLLSFIVFLCLSFIQGRLWEAVGFGAVLGLWLGLFLMFIGPFLCLAVPQVSGAKQLVVVTVVFQLAALAVGISQIAFRWLPFDAGRGFSTLLTVTAMVFFLLFVRQLSRFVGRHDLARGAVQTLAIGAASVLTLILSAVFLIGAGQLNHWLGLAVLILSLVGFVMYANLINALRRELGK